MTRHPSFFRRSVPGEPVAASLLALMACLLAVTFGWPRPALAQPVGGLRWEPIGPAPIDGFFAGGVSGRASAVAVNPQNFDQVFLGTASGGVWYSANGGLDWAPISDHESALAIGDIVPADCTPTECSKLYVGTGENAIRRDTYHGRGLLVGTLDAGNWSWVTRGNTLPHDFTGASITDVVRAPESTGPVPRLYLSVSSGVTTSSAQTTVTAPPSDIDTYGLYRSADDGVTWTRLAVAGSENARPTDLEMNPILPGLLYAGFLGQGVFRSIDGGDSWCPLTPVSPPVPGCPPATWLPSPPLEFDHVELAIADGDTYYASFGHCPDRLFNNCVPSVYRTDDAGSTWTETYGGRCEAGLYSDGTYPRGYSRYTHLLAVSPHDPDEIWLGGIRLWRSLNGGQDFMPADQNALDTRGDGLVIHYDHHEMVFDPATPGRAYETSDGGVAVLEAGAWTPRNVGLQITGYQGIAASPLSGRVIGGAQDNAGSRWMGSLAWDSVGRGDGGNAVIDGANPAIVYLGTNYGGVLGSLNGGNGWCTLKSGTTDTSEPKAFYVPIEQGPPPDRTVYTASNRLYKSVPDSDRCQDYYLPAQFVDFIPISPALAPDDLGPAAEEICRKDSGGCLVSCNGGNVITAIGPAPGDPDRIYVGYYGGQVYVTSDASMPAPAWDDVTGSLPPRPITRIAVDPLDPDVILVSQIGFDAVSSNLWRGELAGAAMTWTASGFGLPAGVPVHVVRYEPGFPDVVWAGLDGNPSTDTVHRSDDGGLSWSAQSAGLPNVPVYDIAFDSLRRVAYAGTHGRGVWARGGPLLLPWEDRHLGERLDLPVMGSLMNDTLQPVSCDIDMFTKSGQICASSTTDAAGASIVADENGTLGADLNGVISPVVWACRDGLCAGGVLLSECDSAQDPLERVEVRCGNALGAADLPGPAVVAGPPSSRLGVTMAGGQPTGSATLTLALHSGDGQSAPLCSVPLVLDAGADPLTALVSVAQSIEADANCAAAGLVPGIDVHPGSEFEDDFERPPTLGVEAPQLVGNQIVTGIATAPGEATGVCLQVHGLGHAAASQLTPTALRITASAGGALGGGLRLELRSLAGACRLDVATSFGDGPEAVAAAIAASLAQGGPDCPPERLARDAIAAQATVRLPLQQSIRICVDDPGLGYSLQSQDILNSHPVAAAEATILVDCAQAGTTPALLSGAGSTDADSTPGTHDDIVQFDWYLDFGQPGEVLLGSGQDLPVSLPVPEAVVTLVAADGGGLSSTATLLVDTTGGSGDGDADGYPTSCDNCQEVANDQADFDQDGRGDACDCAPEDPGTKTAPGNIQTFDWENLNGPEDATVSWTSLAGEAGSSVIYDLISGSLGTLEQSGVTLDECLAEGQLSNQAGISQPLPAVQDGYWYLVRGRNDCGQGIWDSGGVAQILPRQPGVCAASP